MVSVFSKFKFLAQKGLSGVATVQAAEVRAIKDDIRARQPGNVALAGYKVYSQCGEDGILAEIFSRIPHQSTFIEIGTADGRECNTHLLLLKGWRGQWLEGSPGYCKEIRGNLGLDTVPGVFKLVEAFIRKDNIASLYSDGCKFLGVDNVDLFSLDIDGNDLHVLQTLLEAGARPGVLLLEYNGKYPADVSLTVSYRDDRVWEHDDYMGATLKALADVAFAHDYLLLTCELMGVNAFFIRKDLAGAFDTYSVAEAYQPLRVHLTELPTHNHTLKFLRDRLEAAKA